MALDESFLASIDEIADHIADSHMLIWPTPGNPVAFLSFSNFAEWRAFFIQFSLHPNVPLIVTGKFERAQKLHILSWFDADLIKAGELVAFSALEMALRDCYGNEVKRKNDSIHFNDLLKYMVDKDNLTDDKIAMIRRVGGAAVPTILGKRHPSLASIRNDLAHGKPFDGFPWSGLLELLRDLIEYAYRERIAIQNDPI